MTMLDTSTNLANEVVDRVRDFFGREVYETKIPRKFDLFEAPITGLPIIDYDTSHGSRSLRRFGKGGFGDSWRQIRRNKAY